MVPEIWKNWHEWDSQWVKVISSPWLVNWKVSTDAAHMYKFKGIKVFFLTLLCFSTATVYCVHYRSKKSTLSQERLKTGQERSLFARSLWKCSSWFSCVTLVSKVRLVFRPQHEPSVTSNVLNLQPYKRTDTHTAVATHLHDKGLVNYLRSLIWSIQESCIRLQGQSEPLDSIGLHYSWEPQRGTRKEGGREQRDREQQQR